MMSDNNIMIRIAFLLFFSADNFTSVDLSIYNINIHHILQKVTIKFKIFEIKQRLFSADFA